jgi:hypothetical protein
MATNAHTHVSTDHNEIRRWAEQRNGQPACVKGTGDEGDIGILRIDFPGYSGEESLQHVSWADWFKKFDERKLALLFQEKTAGGAESNFNKIVSRETAEESKKGKSSGGRSTSRTKSHRKASGVHKRATAKSTSTKTGKRRTRSS